MTSLTGHINAGFEIIQQGKVAVVAVRQNRDGSKEYVAWHYWEKPEGLNFAWGRYGSLEYAQECFDKKERGEYSG